MAENRICNKKAMFKWAAVTIIVVFLTQLFAELTFPQRFGFFLKFAPRMFPERDEVNTTEDLRQLFAGRHLRIAKLVNVSNNKGGVKQNVSDVVNACPLIPPNLNESIPVIKDELDFNVIRAMYPNVSVGGRWKPPNCIARHRIAIIIPYRNREEHLKIFLRHMHRFLQHQQLDYGIYVVELAEPTQFNRAMLMNIGFVEAAKLYDYQCFFFHDVDLLPENELNIYSCPEQPRHMSAAIDKFNYKLPYGSIFGGVSALTKEQFEKVNGFSNKFFGWGGEDDDMHNRIAARGYKIIRYPIAVARYTMIKHKQETGNPKRMQLLNTGRRRFDTDGLNSLRYKIKSLDFMPLFTRIYVQINQTEVEMN